MDTAILITYDREDAIGEALGLCDAAGYRVAHTVRQKFLKRPKYGMSSMALEELKKTSEKLRPDVIVFDEILKPRQNYNLASELHMEILDRETLILKIFERRASSSESKLQIKLAHLRYEMSRAKERVRLSSMGEQPGFMGIGKFGVDVYYNDIKHRMQAVRTKLAKSGKQRELHRQARRRIGFKIISLAGYTSAGKTTLFNKMTGESGAQGAELFTTLTTTTRRVMIGSEALLISDTVGFISKLPAYMIDAFKSTLEELGYADVVIVVIDAADTSSELRKKFSSCMKTLGELGIEKDKIVYALNKSDLIDAGQIDRKIEILGLEESKKCVPVSAYTGTNIARIKEIIGSIAGVGYEN
ncbi:MAG: GTPase HflX [Nitrosopumilus sp. B06]|nr:MAG: GTPase HflX [Nitrosopumilus sp. B06]